MSIDPFGAAALTIAVIAAGVYIWRARVAKKAKREALERRLADIEKRNEASVVTKDGVPIEKAPPARRPNRGT